MKIEMRIRMKRKIRIYGGLNYLFEVLDLYIYEYCLMFFWLMMIG